MMPEGDDFTGIQIIEEGPRMMPEGDDFIGIQIIEEGPRICPLCSSLIKQFNIHYHEKLLLCENEKCIFPFGCEELNFEKDTTGADDDEMSDIVSSRSQSPLSSMTDSDVMTSEIETLKKLCESDDYLSEPTTSSKLPNEVNKKMEKGSGITKSQKNKNLQLDRKLVQPQEIEKLTKQEELVSELKTETEPGTSGCM